MHTSLPGDHSQGSTSKTEQITVQLDRLSQAALDVLRAGGTSDTDAVRAAITDLAERLPDPPLHARSGQIANVRYAERLATLATSAPPLTEYQRYVLTAAFIDGDTTWLGEEQWLALRSTCRTSAPDHRDSTDHITLRQAAEPTIRQT